MSGERRTQLRSAPVAWGEAPQDAAWRTALARQLTPQASNPFEGRVVDYPRDLGQVELWQESLERSLARRGRTKRSSVEFSRLRAEQNLLTLEEMVLDSSQYSRLRRRAAEHPLRPRVAVAAGGVSALTLLAVTTLPGLLGGRSSTERIAYAAKLGRRGQHNRNQTSSATQPRSMPAGAFNGHSTSVGLRHHAVSQVLSVSESTQQLQRRLGVVADGEFGPITLRAVKGAQVSHHLVVDGIVGPATRNALGLPAGPILRANPIYFPKPVKRTHPVHHVTHVAQKPVHHAPRPHQRIKTLSIGATIRLMQERIGVPADGQFGPTTFRALKAWQAHHGLVADGILGPATRHALGLPPGPVLHANRALFPHRATRGSGPARHHAAPRPRRRVHHSPPPRPSTGYVNPLAHASVTPERIDAGVDYSGTGTLTALGEGRVTYVGTSGTGWPGAFVEYQLLNGTDAGRYVYYAEGVRPGVSVGQTVQAGQAVAYLIPGWSSGIEIGWGSGVGTQPLAQKLGENSFPTAAGESFSALIASLGGPPGIP